MIKISYKLKQQCDLIIIQTYYFNFLIQQQPQYLDQLRMIKLTIGLALIFHQIYCCFIVHFVYYGELSDYDFQRISRFNYPYIFHLDEDIKLPRNHQINRNLTAVQKSDVKKMEVIYHHGGLYLDNDHFIDAKCIQNIFCPLDTGMYLLDWTDRSDGYWLTSAPISFIYSNQPKNQTIQKILTSYNQSEQQTIFFSGPNHVQKFRSQLKFIKVDQNCQYHIGIQSWNKQKNFQYNWIMRKWRNTKNNDGSETQSNILFNKQKQLFYKLWKSHSVIYPSNFDYKSIGMLNSQFNHVQLTDKNTFNFKVVQYSKFQNIKKKIKQVQQYYQSDEIKKFTKIKPNAKIKEKTNQHKNKILTNNNIQYIQQNLKQNSQNKYSILFRQTTVIIMILTCVALLLFKYAKQRQINCPQNLCKFLRLNYEQINEVQKRQQNKDLQQSEGFKNGIKNTIKYATLMFIVSIVIISNTNFFARQNQFLDIYNSQTKFLEKIIQNQKNQKQIDNQQYRKKYGIQWRSQKDNIYLHPQIGLIQMGIYYNIHAGSQFDFLNVTQSTKFKNFKNQFFSQIKYTAYSTQRKMNSNSSNPTHPFEYKQILNGKYIQQIISKMNKWGNRPLAENNRQLYLASYLTYNLESQTIKQVQNYYYNKKYRINQYTNQLPICVITTQSQMKTNYNISAYFDSINRQRYNNYHIVMIDDHTPDNQYLTWLKELENKQYGFKDRIKIIRNHKKMGNLANHYAYVSKFCDRKDIVVNLYAQDSLIGFQVFNLLNSVYQNQSIWYTYSRSLYQPTIQSKPIFGNDASKIILNFSDYRINNEWKTSGLRTYRQKLMRKVPIQQFIQYQFDNATQTITPVFPSYGDDRYEVFAHLELSGKDRVKYMQQALLLVHDEGMGEPCEKQLIRYFRYKAITKNSMKPLTQLNGSVQYEIDRIYDKRILIQFKDWYVLYNRCYKIFHMDQNLI